MSDKQGLVINPEMHLIIDKIKHFEYDRRSGDITQVKMRPTDRERARFMLLLAEQHPEYGFQDVCADDPEGFGTDIKPCVACNGRLMPEYHLHFMTRFLKEKDGLGPQEVWTGIRWTTAGFLSDIVASDYLEYCALRGFKLPL